MIVYNFYVNVVDICLVWFGEEFLYCCFLFYIKEIIFKINKLMNKISK